MEVVGVATWSKIIARNYSENVAKYSSRCMPVLLNRIGVSCRGNRRREIRDVAVEFSRRRLTGDDRLESESSASGGP